MIQEGVKQIEVMFGREYPNGTIPYFVEGLRNEPSDSLIKAVRHFEDSGDFKMLPAPKDLIRIVREISATRRDREQELRHAEQRRNSAHENGKGKSFEIGKEIRGFLFSGKITRRQFLDCLKHADMKDPGVGWDKAGIDMMKYYETTNRSLDDKPSLFINDTV